MDKKKKKFKREKWPYQNRATPIGAPPKGFWYNPEVKESSENGDSQKPSLRDALHHFSSHPDSLGKPEHISMSDSKVEFASGQTLSFKEVIHRYIQTTQGKSSEKGKGTEKGFYDSPVDVGKDPKGDFPSNSWLPKGTEDMNMNIDQRGLGLSKLDKQAEEEFITEESKEEIASTAGAEYISALKHYFDAIRNKHPKDRAIEYSVNEMKKQDISISPTKLLELVSLYLI